MAAVKHRCSRYLTAIDWFTSSRYDTAGTLTKTSWFVTYCRPFDSLLKVKPVLQIVQHMPKQVQELHTSKVKPTCKLSNQNAEKIAINRNEYAYILPIDTKITLYSAKHEQQLNTEHYKRKLTQKHVIY